MIRFGGGKLIVDGDRIRYFVPSGDAEARDLLAELRKHREEVAELPRRRAGWPTTSLEAERRFGQPHAKLFQFLGRKVRTPRAGTFTDRF